MEESGDIVPSTIVPFQPPSAFFTELKKSKYSVCTDFHDENRRLKFVEKTVPEHIDTKEILTSFLGVDKFTDNISECVTNAIEAGITYNDLAMLNDEDLEMIGFKDAEKRKELLVQLSGLPNTNNSYEFICDDADSQLYNAHIVIKAANHLSKMTFSLDALTSKIRNTPPEDPVLGEKYFSSRFVIEALSEMQDASKSIEAELAQIEAIMSAQMKNNKQKYLGKRTWILLSLFGASIIGLGCYFKFKK